jgi:general secretion pathway protein K
MRRPGFALIAVFWIVMVVGLFAAIVASRTGFDLDRSGWTLGMGKARAAADGAVEEAAFQLVGRINAGVGAGASGLDLRDLAEFEVRIDDVPVRVSVEDEDGKIDLNGAQPELLAVLIEAVMRENKGLAADDALTLSERIADFRDIDNLRRLHGAEDPEYLAAGLTAGAKDAAFDIVGELGQVLGMTPALAEAVTPFITVHNGRSQFDPEAGPLPLKALASGIEGAGLAISVAPSRRRVFTVRAVAALPNGVMFERRAALRVSGDARQPVTWIGWRPGG